jgi:hypothetical protein
MLAITPLTVPFVIIVQDPDPLPAPPLGGEWNVFERLSWSHIIVVVLMNLEW